MADFERKDKYAMADLLAIMKLLRSPDGCPWDREQNHHSIRKNFIEETYEAVEAIDNEDSALLLEELGDVLLQVVFHAQIESDAGGFDFDAVCDGICKKLIVRHPHVFGDLKVSSGDEVLKNWEQIKNDVKGVQTATETLKNVPKVQPALMRAQKISHRAAKAGVTFVDANAAAQKLAEDVRSLTQNLTAEDVSAQLGRVLFDCAHVARLLSVDAEQALGKTSDRFIGVFSRLEEENHLTEGKSSLLDEF